MNTTNTNRAEPASRAFERAIMGADFLQDLAQQAKRNLYDQERQHGRADDRLVRAVALHVELACSLVGWKTIEVAARLDEGKP
jgi:hypothetical protein